MRTIWNIAYIAIIITFFTSCEQPIEEFAYDWSRNVKMKIIEESHIESDWIEIDSSKHDWQVITYWRGDNKLRKYNYRPSKKDTVVSIFYSKSQEFELIRELCPSDRSFEGIRYKGEHLGLAEFRFCDGTLYERGLRLDGDVGLWTEYDESGNLIKSRDYGNLERLNKLREINYE